MKVIGMLSVVEITREEALRWRNDWALESRLLEADLVICEGRVLKNSQGDICEEGLARDRLERCDFRCERAGVCRRKVCTGAKALRDEALRDEANRIGD